MCWHGYSELVASSITGSMVGGHLAAYFRCLSQQLLWITWRSHKPWQTTHIGFPAEVSFWFNLQTWTQIFSCMIACWTSDQINTDWGKVYKIMWVWRDNSLASQLQQNKQHIKVSANATSVLHVIRWSLLFRTTKNTLFGYDRAHNHKFVCLGSNFQMYDLLSIKL